MKLSIARTLVIASLALFTISGSGTDIPSRPPTTREQTVRPVPMALETPRIQASALSNYVVYGYNQWQTGPGVDQGRMFLSGTEPTQAPNAARLLSFFVVTDTHLTDKESPSQSYAISYLSTNGGNSSAYSPTVLYTTHVLDAAIRTVNALHRQTPFDFGISIGDAANSPQYNELRWFIDIFDGGRIEPSSGGHVGATSIDYQMPYQAPGLDPSIPWYQTLGNHDHWWLGSYPVIDYFKQNYTNDTVLLMGDLFSEGVDARTTFMGTIDGSTPYGNVVGAGPVENFIVGGVTNFPKVVADTNRMALTKSQWMNEFFKSTSTPLGHGFAETNVTTGFACYTFEPKANLPLRVIVFDDTQGDTNFDMHMQGAVDDERFAWLVNELDKGQAEDKLMIISAHVPLHIIGHGGTSPVSAATITAKLRTYPNLLLWISGHVHRNAITPIPPVAPAGPEYGFWVVETASLRDYPQQFRTMDILRNSDNTISILATDVDPAVKIGEPAEISRGYAVAAARIFTNPCPSFLDTNSYAINAELIKVLSTNMQAKISAYGGPLGHRLAVQREGTEAVTTFMGKLQSADTIPGQWTDVPATNLYRIPTTGSSKFYRAVE